MSKRSPKLEFFAACAPGLEELLLEELKQLHVGNAAADTAGVMFTGTFETMVKVNLQSRIAERILLRMATFQAAQLRTLEAETTALPFEYYLRPDCRVYVQATCKKSKIYHSGAAGERVANAIQHKVALRAAPKIQTAPSEAPGAFALIQVRIIRDQVTISIDTSGDLLHKRGYRTAVTEAPMRETVAAAALRFCEYTGEIPFVDPMCGSGTFAIEAALIASRTAPGLNRSFAFEQWPTFDKAVLAAEKDRAKRFARPFDGIIQGSDKLSSALDATSHNVDAVGMKRQISLSTAELSRITLPEKPGLIIVNPPWGKRLDSTTSLYEQIGHIKRTNPSWRICLLTSHPKLAKATGIRFKKISPPIPVGGVRIKFYLG